MKAHFFNITLVGALILAAVNAHADEQRNQHVLPAELGAIVSVHGKPTSSREFENIKRHYDLVLYSIRDQLDLPHFGALPLPANHHRVRREVMYGGSGMIIVAASESVIEGDLAGKISLDQTHVERIRLIVGKCLESEQFGIWNKGPSFAFATSPDALLNKYRGADTDTLSLTFAGAAGAIRRALRDRPIHQTRRINYYVPPVWTDFPYAFVFEFDRLVAVDLWPSSPPAQIVRPTPPNGQ
jgi:hypothetical protein